MRSCQADGSVLRMSGDDELALFDLPSAAVESRESSSRTPGRGRARETYARRVVADVTVIRESVLREAALRVLDEGVAIDLGPAEGDVADDPDPRAEIEESAVAALTWVLEPTADLWCLLEADAFLLTNVEISVDETSSAACQVSWTVTVKLRDVAALRAAALAACPAGDAGRQQEIERSLAAAWNLAADPYAPLRDVPGIAWTGRGVDVEQVYARQRRA